MRTSPGVIIMTLMIAFTGSATGQQAIMLPRTDRLLPGQPAPAYTIGALTGEDWELLSNVRSVAFDHADNLYVLDAGNFRVLVFDREGRFLRQIGRQGDGPGELSAPTAIAITRDARLAVADLARRGYSIFERDGTFVGTVTSPDERGMVLGSQNSNAIDADPNGWLIVRSMPSFGLGDRAALRAPSASPVYRQPRADDATTITLYEFPLPEPRVQDSDAGGGRRARIAVIGAPTFSPPTLWGVLPTGGIAVAHDAEYRIRLTDATGNVTTVLERPIAARAVNDDDREQARERLRRQAESGDGGVRVANVNGRSSFSVGGGDMSALAREMMAERMESMEFAATMPVIRGMLTDVTGRIWIERENGDLFSDGPIDLLTADGRYIGTVTGMPLPDAVSPHGLAAFITRDEEYGIEQIVVKRLPAQWSAPGR